MRMRLSTSRRPALLIIGVTMIAGATGAQERRLAPDDSVMPIALFRAFTQSTGRPGAGNETSVMVGQIPSGLALRLPELPNATVLGMISTSSFDLVAMDVPGSAERVRARIVESLPQRGWRSPSLASPAGGFVRPNEGSSTWCGESSALFYDVQQVDREAVRVLSRLTPSDRGMCSPARGRPRRVLPTLYDPEEARSHAPECNSGATTGGVSSTMEFVASSLSPTALLDHYSRQLADSGWRPVPSTGEGALVRRTWRRSASKSETPSRPPNPSASPQEPEDRLLTVTVQIPDGKPGCRVLEMRIDTQTFR